MDDRIVSAKIDALRARAIAWSEPLLGWSVRTATNVRPGQYEFDSDWVEAACPCTFRAGQTVFLRCHARVPEDLRKADTCLQFDVADMDGLLSVDGRPYAGVDVNHRRVVVPRTGEMDISLEFVSVPWAASWPGGSGHRSTFSGARVCTVDREIESLYHDVSFAWETSKVAADERRKLLLGRAVELAVLALDLTRTGEQFLAEVRQAAAILKTELGRIAQDPEAGRIFATGHTHIDVAWLWPVRETVRKTSRTFATACRLMERYPDFHFSCSQAQLYQYAKLHYPELYQEVKKWVATGRWETTGAMWLEPDCNVTSGESLIRQILHGLRFFREEFGTRPRSCWLPDVFGYPASLPEILKGCGLSRFFTVKLHWQSKNRFPYHLFRWRGLDGSEVTAHIPDLPAMYNGDPTPYQMLRSWNQYNQKAKYPEILFTYGYGDGGGGVTENMQEMMARAQKGYPGLPAVRTGPSERYFEDVEAAEPNLAIWDGELYLETHRGTYTTQGKVKRANRVCEMRLREAELFGSFAQVGGAVVDWPALRAAWETVLLQQFHDILPGSSITPVYVEALKNYAAAQHAADGVLATSLRQLIPSLDTKDADGLCLFNSLSWVRTDIATATIADPGPAQGICLKGQDGKSCPAQVVGRSDGQVTIAFQPPEVPPMGYAKLELSRSSSVPTCELSVSARRIETPHFVIELTALGEISRLFDKLHQREVIASGAVGNDLQLLQDGPETEDAWNVHATSDLRHYVFEGETSVAVIESGPVRGMVRVRRTHRKTTIEQDIVVYAGTPRVDFVTRVDWHEQHTMLKVAFPLAIRSTRATYEVQFGAVERPTHRNTSWDQEKFEVAGQRWADLSEAGYGVSLLNDCKYGYDALGNVLRLTLLRGTTSPDPTADQGSHEFTYSLFPHAGSWCEGGTVQRSLELNAPIRAVPVRIGGQHLRAHSFVSLAGAAAIAETIKPAEDGRGLILRIYEPHGGRGEVAVTLQLPVRKVNECNLVETDADTPVQQSEGSFRFEIQPFQIRTFRLLFA